MKIGMKVIQKLQENGACLMNSGTIREDFFEMSAELIERESGIEQLRKDCKELVEALKFTREVLKNKCDVCGTTMPQFKALEDSHAILAKFAEE